LIRIVLKLVLKIRCFSPFSHMKFSFIHIGKILENVGSWFWFLEDFKHFYARFLRNLLAICKVDNFFVIPVYSFELFILDVLQEHSLDLKMPKPFQWAKPVFKRLLTWRRNGLCNTHELIALYNTWKSYKTLTKLPIEKIDIWTVFLW